MLKKLLEKNFKKISNKKQMKNKFEKINNKKY